MQAGVDVVPFRYPLDHRIELDKAHTLGLEEVIDLQRMAGDIARHGDQHVDLHRMLEQQAQPP
ncbi:hypothetical protein D9M68_849980 [compost metagenome]